MKIKHGFIGNSSSASYYVRRAPKATVNYYKDGAGVDTSGVIETVGDLTAITGGSTYDGVYKFHPHNICTGASTVSIPVGYGSSTNKVEFRYAALCTKGVYTNIRPDNFTDHANSSIVYVTGNASLVMEPLIPGVPWETNNVRLDDTQAGATQPPGHQFSIVLNWDGNRLRIAVNIRVDCQSAAATTFTLLDSVKLTNNAPTE